MSPVVNNPLLAVIEVEYGCDCKIIACSTSTARLFNKIRENRGIKATERNINDRFNREPDRWPGWTGRFQDLEDLIKWYNLYSEEEDLCYLRLVEVPNDDI